jgi:glycosyltransferase involved in cell wall biosynthesis
VSLRVLFATSTSPSRASARFRVYQFLPYFQQWEGLEIVDVVPVGSARSPLRLARTFLALAQRARQSDLLFIQRARLPIPYVRWMARQCRIIYDFDDAIFVPRTTVPGDGLRRRLQRLEYVLARSSAVIAGNQYLADYSSQYADQVVVVPTVVDTGQDRVDAAAFRRWAFDRQVFAPPERQDLATSLPDPVVVGWIGGPWHIQWLDMVGPALVVLQQRYGIEVKVVSSREWHFPGLEVRNKKWSLADEVADVQSFDLGLMPLDPSLPRLQGKCGFKIIAYMAAGVAPVASAVGVNTEIIEQGVSGFLVSDSSEWQCYLELLVTDLVLRRRMVTAARQRIVSDYSIASVLPHYAGLFRAVAT